MDRSPEQPGGQLKLSLDFYTLSEFRDLACHVSETCMTLLDIRRFLDEAGLCFRGFHIDPLHLEEFHRRYPNEAWPGRLEVWEEFEAARPDTFSAMYNFWCDRK
jgi:hypothetical protein